MRKASFISCLFIAFVLVAYRGYYSDIGGERKGLVITQWDAFGYYLYLPATIIYHDYKKLEWAAGVDKKYNVTGGDGMPVQQLDNGNKVTKYLGGVAILQLPFFTLGHIIAKLSGQPTDGFSPPYQYALSFGVILYCVLALFLLRTILLRYFEDVTVALTLLLLCLATNFIQYIAIHNGLSHGWIFPFYVLLIYATIRWHQQPRAGWALLTGYIIGLATICRPTEAVALFIPLLWNLHNKDASRAKWAAVKAHRLHVFYAVLGGFMGVLPQLLYWKSVAGSWVYDVGSKWVFFSPWWRVLIGWEKGWFIYTPVTVLFITGLFFVKPFPFRKAAIAFCLLNIWIIISWDEWQYGASYSTRALVQSYPVFALPLAAVVARIQQQKWRPVFWVMSAYLIAVNIFQTVQYNKGILHYKDMNRQYYSRIYLNRSPSPLDMSLLDTREWLSSEKGYQVTILQQPAQHIQFSGNGSATLADIRLDSLQLKSEVWLRVNARITAPGKLWHSWLNAQVQTGDSVKKTSIRLLNPVGEKTGAYAFYMNVPPPFRKGNLKLLVSSDYDFEGSADSLSVTILQR
jgi:hypothetical protein